MPRRVRIASINVNGIRAATRKGMLEWLVDADVDILALQEVRAHGGAARRLAAGVGGLRRALAGPKRLDASGRWLEADFVVDGEQLTVVSAYVPSGEADTPKQDQKWDFLNAMEKRMRQLRTLTPLALVMGDLNVGHRELDIRNWKGNVKRAGFLPRERAYFDRLFGPTGTIVTGVDGSRGRGQGWVDVGRRFHGEVDGPYTWWSMMARAPSWDTRWSDHAPVVADYTVGA